MWAIMRVVGALTVGVATGLAFHAVLGEAYGLATFPVATLLTFMRLRDPQP